jgi:hypothetical protein
MVLRTVLYYPGYYGVQGDSHVKITDNTSNVDYIQGTSHRLTGSRLISFLLTVINYLITVLPCISVPDPIRRITGITRSA